MSSFLHRLRNKPEKTRHRIAIGTSAGVTGLVFIMWITVLSYGGIMDTSTTGETTVVNESPETTSPLSSLRANAATAFMQLREGFESAATTSENILKVDTDKDTDDSEAAPASNGRDFEDGSASYWEKQNNFPAATSVIDDTSDNSDTGKKVPFTSLEYDPSQESEWLIE